MENKVKVTIGMCVKNSERTLRQAMESIIYQDFPHQYMELIVVDGYSKDGTLSIVDDYLNKMPIRNRFIREKEGLGRARQIVVDNANGEYIVWVDSDMTLSRNFVRKQVKFMEDHPNVGIAKGRYAWVPGPNLLATLEIYSRIAAKLVDYSQEKASSKSLGTSGCIYRVEAIKQAGGFDENIKGYGEDWDAEYRTRANGWLLCTTQVQYQDYERFGISWKELWQRYWRRGYDMHDVFRKHKEVIKLYKMLPPAAFLTGLINSSTLYRVLVEEKVFLLPLQHALKMIAWWLGFLSRRLELCRFCAP